jgi:hypothetical protein
MSEPQVILNKMKKIIFVLISLSIISCGKEEVNNSTDKIIIEYKNEAILYGNDFSYSTYLEYAENNNLFLEKLSLSIIMNSKYDNIKSNFEIFKTIIELQNNNVFKTQYVEKLDYANKSYALYYLVKGAKKNHTQCQTILESIYRKGIGLEKNTIKSDSLYFILENSPSIGRFYKDNRKNKSKVDVINYY